MDNIETTEGDFISVDGRFAIIASRFNGYIVEALVKGALDVLRRHGVNDTDIQLYHVPGAYEIPLVADKLAVGGQFRAIIALGAVIRGSTPHFDIVAGESARGLSNVMLKHGIPVANGILTTDTVEQAIERAGTKAGNKGADAAMSAIEMASLIDKIT